MIWKNGFNTDKRNDCNVEPVGLVEYGNSLFFPLTLTCSPRAYSNSRDRGWAFITIPSSFGAGRYSEGVTVANDFYSERFLFWRVIIPKILSRRVIISKILFNPEGFLFQRFYPEWSLFRKCFIPKGRYSKIWMMTHRDKNFETMTLGDYKKIKLIKKKKKNTFKIKTIRNYDPSEYRTVQLELPSTSVPPYKMLTVIKNVVKWWDNLLLGVNEQGQCVRKG